MFDMIEIGRRIAGYRKEKGMTQMGLANELSVSIDEIRNRCRYSHFWDGKLWRSY